MQLHKDQVVVLRGRHTCVVTVLQTRNKPNLCLEIQVLSR